MRTLQHLAFVLLATTLFAACSDSPTTTTTQLGGPLTVDEFTQNTAYVWYQTGYEAYPTAENQQSFQDAVNRIKAAMNGGENEYSMLMVLKPNCGCQHTQTEMPRVMKTLDMAGFPRQNIEIYLTDTRLAGIDDIKAQHNISSSDDVPTFIIFRNDTEIGRIEQQPASGSTVENDLASIFES